MCVRLFLYFLIVSPLVMLVFCFNFEDRDPMVKKAPENQKDSYFGFSVALHKTRANSNDIKDNWLLVGAPLGQNLQPGSNRSGALFKCPYSKSDDDCEQVETDGKRVEEFDYDDDGTSAKTSLQVQGNDEIKTGQWLGVTVKSQKPGGVAMVCAHRYIQSPDISKFHYGQGLCYLLDAKLQVTETLQLCRGRPMEKLHQQFGFCQLGTSMSFVGDEFALMGAPGPYTWRGTVFGQVVVGDFMTKDKTVYHSPVSDTDVIEKYSYLGMSVGGGHFWDKTKYHYVAGAPRSKMIGAVYFFMKNNSDEFSISLTIEGEQFASSFGYEILIADVNNDGYDDLLVGAPFYYNDNKGGAVYVYYNIRKCDLSPNNCLADKVFYGKPQSRFGFSMASLGDINKDGYNDVAIGAPYENDHGAVYIYLGSQNGLNDEPSQHIKIKELKTLGYSLSGGIDMDNNGYPDLLVGSYESEKVLLFRTRPIIDIKIKITGNELKNINATRKGCKANPNGNHTCFSFQCCITIMSKVRKAEKFNVIYQIEEMKKFVSRVYFNDPHHPDKHVNYHTAVVPVSKYSKEYCQNELVYIRDGVSDILSPIKFRVNYTLENDRHHEPILNKTSVKDFEATFQKECGDDDICESKLVLSAGTNFTKKEDGLYYVNITNEFILETNITNLGESAYEAKLFVTHPEALSYIALKTDNDDTTNVKCSLINDTMIACDIGNPFPRNRTLNTKLRFELLKKSKVQTLNINLFVNSTSKELSKKTSQSIAAVIQKIAKFEINGKASTSLFYGGSVVGETQMKHLEDIGARVTHTYQIHNNGEWDLPDIQVKIDWPIQVSPGPSGGRGKWLLYLEQVPEVINNGGYCEVLNRNDRSMVNELNLSLETPKVDDPQNLMMVFDIQKPNETIHSRIKRSLKNYVVPSHTEDKNGRKSKVVTMDCQSNPQSARCVEIVCTIKRLSHKEQALIIIKSRIWNSTLVEDYNNVDWVEIRSHASVQLRDLSFEIHESRREFSAETIAYPEVVIADSGLNWWIIGGSILVGLILLVIIMIILYMCGFFKRKRVSDDPTLSGNLQKKGESDHLLTEMK